MLLRIWMLSECHNNMQDSNQGVWKIYKMDFPDKYLFSLKYFIVSIEEKLLETSNLMSLPNDPKSNYQAKQRRNITSASLKHLNSSTPLTFWP